MRKSNIAIFIVAILIIIVLAISFIPRDTNETVKLGWISALSGPVAYYGQPSLNGAQIAIEEINNEGGINGKKVELIIEDGKCDPKEAATVAQKLINLDNVKVILGGHCSPETLGAAPIAEQNKVILFASVSTSPGITNAGDYIFRNSPVSTQMAIIMANFAYNEDFRRIAIITEQTAYAKPIVDTFKKEFERLGGEITNFEEYPSEQNEFRDAITKIKNSDPDAIFISPQSQQKADLIIRQIKELGIQKQLFGNDVIGSNIGLALYQGNAEGLIFAQAQFDKEDPMYREFVAKYKAKYNVDEIPYEGWTAESYDAVKLIAEAIKEVGYDSNKIKEYLYNVKDWKGASGSLTIDEFGDGSRKYGLGIIKDDTLQDYQP